ncbi:phytanoyl-CoA dioxygenase [Mangrovimicrobium sediminis]|uniref:Phytanoyl-CoA dioxygenase n=1 Tax=Mangrovimicrobium sediminis TaxID=2562682 RepID=A0A4Z0M9T1_9GAMM|nr:phytanoyl-CoA dioxygenase family protein [Haliea sp. SAOS-164]TGD76147.1 phytanoyl-CoA dioxygenase [Haliea sp. SAOS-164]
MSDQARVLESPCRDVTAQEIAHYHEHGWVKLSKFIKPDVIALLLQIAKRRMGEDGDSNDSYGLDQPYFNAEAAEGLGNQEVRALIEGIGRNATALLARKGIRARYFSDFFAPKLPCSKQTRNAGNGATAFHQDYITFAVDRTGGMTFWIPLEPYGAQAGTMSFITGSHKMGVMGSYHTYGDGDARDAFPELLDLPMTDPIEYELGDITVHTHLTIHGAGQNQTDKPRWAYLVLAQPEDACWNGAPPEAFDTTGMTPNQRLDDERFPIIG